MPIISIIIPCYNHGAYIEEALESICLNEYSEIFEVIIVDDGSTDSFTIEKLKLLKDSGWFVVNQENKGLAAARNKGISLAKGKYVLPLDSDNKIIPQVFVKAFHIMEADSSIDIVYTDAIFFGEKSGIWRVGEFEALKLVHANYIDACALIRKEKLIQIGCYEENSEMVMGHEDWALWLNFIFNGGNFYYLQEKGFYYRILGNSMIRNNQKKRIAINRDYLFEKHKKSIQQLEKNIQNKIKSQFNELKLVKKYKLKRYIKNFFDGVFCRLK